MQRIYFANLTWISLIYEVTSFQILLQVVFIALNTPFHGLYQHMPHLFHFLYFFLPTFYLFPFFQDASLSFFQIIPFYNLISYLKFHGVILFFQPFCCLFLIINEQHKTLIFLICVFELRLLILNLCLKFQQLFVFKDVFFLNLV